MNLREKLIRELEALAVTSLYFALWASVLLVTKELILAEYQIRFRGLTLILLATVVFAKVVLVMEHVPLGKWVEHRPAVLSILVRTALYGLGVLIVMLLEKAFEARRESGGFGPALAHIFEHRDMPHVWVNTLWAVCALLVFNALVVVRQHVGRGGLIHMLLTPPPAEPPTHIPAPGK